jgi:hypothetical protein
MTPLAKKLGLKPGMQVRVEHAPAGYFVQRSEVGGDPFRQTFVTSRAELMRDAAWMIEDERAVVWVTYPKKSSGVPGDLSREVVRDVMSAMGWIAVTIVSVDEVWSALRFRPKAMVKTMRDR